MAKHWSKILSCSCGMKFRSYAAEGQHRHNFPAYCKKRKQRMPKKSSDRMAGFRLAVHGWAFCNADMMRSRLAAGEMEVKLMRDLWTKTELLAAENTLASIRRAIGSAER